LCLEQIKSHKGNLRFQEILKEESAEYADLDASRSMKSAIIIKVINRVREKSAGNYGFVKRDHKSGRWMILEDIAARTTVGQGFRDLNPEKDEPKGSKKQAKEAIRAQASSPSSSCGPDGSKMAPSPAFSGVSSVMVPMAAGGAGGFAGYNQQNQQTPMMVVTPNMFSAMFNNAVVDRSWTSELAGYNSAGHMPYGAPAAFPTESSNQQQWSTMRANGNMALSQQQRDSNDFDQLLATANLPDQPVCNPFEPAPLTQPLQNNPFAEPPMQNLWAFAQDQEDLDQLTLYQAMEHNRFK
jgi:hypothetical protein